MLGTNSIVRSNHQDLQAIKKENKTIIELLNKSRDENRKVNSYLQANIPDMKSFFPLQDEEMLQRFLDETDGLFPLRRQEFCNMILPCVTDKKNSFGTAILNTFFSKNFIKTHSWPSKTG